MTTPSAPTDPRPLLRRALEQSLDVVRQMTPAELDLPTPCSEFDARTLIGHMVFAADRVAAAGRGEPIPVQATAVTAGIPDAELARAFAGRVDETVAAWDRPGALEGEVALPFGTFPATVVVLIYTLEQVTHAWDLAAATDRVETLDAGLAEDVLPFARQMLPAEGREDPNLPFDPVVEVPTGASPYDRLAGHMGRHPASVPAPAKGGGGR